MDSQTYSDITGRSLSSDQEARFDAVAEYAGKRLETLLGYPLNPDDWESQHIEIGKTRSDCPCPDVDVDELDGPDAVTGTTRYFKFHADEPYLHIDPATEIHSVKLVKDGVTFKTLESSDYRINWQNGVERYARYLQIFDRLGCWCGSWRKYPLDFPHVQIVVDATWAFEEIPEELLTVWAEIITRGFDKKRNVRSETVESHSYTKVDEKPIEQEFAGILNQYAGPNGSAKRPRLT